MTALPNSLALTQILTDAQVLSADHRGNYGAIQTAVNQLIAALSGGTVGQLLQALDGTDVAWTSGAAPFGTVFPAAPVDGQEFVYAADATNGVYWRFKWIAASNKWRFGGGPPLLAEVTTQETTASAAYAALTTPGPSIVLPFAADYDVAIGMRIGNTGSGAGSFMSYDIGATGAVDADDVQFSQPATVNTATATISRMRRKTGLTAVTLTAKYKTDGGSTGFFANRWMSVTPVQK